MKYTELFDKNGYNKYSGLFKSRYYAEKWLKAHNLKKGKIIKFDSGYPIVYLDKGLKE